MPTRMLPTTIRPRFQARIRITALAVAALVVAACSAGGSGGSGGAEKAGGSPVVVGFINQENAPTGSFPEVRTDAEAAVRYVNAKLGGVGGHPIRLETCATDGSPESSQGCANRLRQKQPVAVLGGLDLGAAASIPVLDSAGIPYVGASPTLGDELTASAASMLTGGAAADLLGQAQYITDTLHAKKVGVVYIDLPGLLSTAVEVAKDVLAKKGVTDVKAVAEKADTADFTPALNDVNRNNPDVILAVFPPQGCTRIMAARQALSIKAKVMFPGACAAQSVIDASGGGANGAYFTSGFLAYDGNDPDVVAYREQRKKYGATEPPSALAQAGFAEVMDLRQLMSEISLPLSPGSINAALRTTKDHHGFMSHPYTCDRQQVFLLSAVCNANVRLLQYGDGHFTDVANDWVNGSDLIRLYLS
ncbi:MAG: branched-chain amino acid transport system substrate-binding protein [Acidimicrobiaceae bacterium]